jgi:hypothetical protein
MYCVAANNNMLYSLKLVYCYVYTIGFPFCVFDNSNNVYTIGKVYTTVYKWEYMYIGGTYTT